MYLNLVNDEFSKRERVKTIGCGGGGWEYSHSINKAKMVRGRSQKRILNTKKIRIQKIQKFG